MGPVAVIWSCVAGMAYVIDVIARPAAVARDATSYARACGKPVLNVGAGTDSSSLRAYLFGPTLWGDLNLDIAAPKNGACGPDRVCWGDAMDLSRFPDKHFGSAIASHVLEHVPDPAKMMREMARVADRVYLITPPVYAPHSLLYPDHKWQISDRHACALLWHGGMPIGQCVELPYSISGAARGVFA